MVRALMLALVMCAVGGSIGWRSGINFMALEVSELEKRLSLPNLPGLVDQLKLTNLYDAVVTASLGDTLSGPGPFTLFAPTNQAFRNAPDWLNHMLKNVTILKEILKYHLLAGEVFSKDIKDELSVATADGKPIRLNIYPKNKVITAQCAPINVTFVDQMASNGVLHELNAIMIPPYGDIVQTVGPIDMFSILVSALTKADLLGTLSGKGPFTVFAPTDKAFNKLDPKTLDDILSNKTKLTNVLKYHVTSLTYCKAGLVSYNSLPMLNKDNVTVTVQADRVMVNNAMLLPHLTDVSVTNGVIHAIDTVLIPPSLR